MCHILPSEALWDPRPVFNRETEGQRHKFKGREEREERKQLAIRFTAMMMLTFPSIYYIYIIYTCPSFDTAAPHN